MKFRIIVVSLFIFSCSQFDKKIETIKQNNDVIEYILSPVHFVGKKAIGVYKLQEVFSVNDSNYIQLKQTGLINSSTRIYYSSPQCISLVIRTKEKNAGGFIDYVISNNLNEFDFACGLNNIYNLNQNENITQLQIKIKETNSLLTLAIVEGD